MSDQDLARYRMIRENLAWLDKRDRNFHFPALTVALKEHSRKKLERGPGCRQRSQPEL
jgi:hypothetical protein